MKSEFGILYCINSQPHYRAMMQLSIKSIRRFHPETPIEVVRLSTPADYWERLRWWVGSNAEKKLKTLLGVKARPMQTMRECLAERIRLLSSSPFDKTLFIDSDTIVVRPLDNLFSQMTDSVDLIAQRPTPGLTYKPIPPHFPLTMPVVNAGVFVFSRQFAETLNHYALACPIDISTLPDGDQYLFNYCIQDAKQLNVTLIDKLQSINAPVQASEGYRRPNDLLRAKGDSTFDSYVFHYILRKRIWYRDLRRLVRQGMI